MLYQLSYRPGMRGRTLTARVSFFNLVRTPVALLLSALGLLSCGKVADVPIYVVLPQSNVTGVPEVFSGVTPGGADAPPVQSLRVSVRTGAAGSPAMITLSTHVQEFRADETNVLSIKGLTGGRQRYVVLEGLAETAAQIENGVTPTVLARGVSAPEDYLAPGQAEPQGKKYPAVTLFFGRLGRFSPLRSGLSDARAFFGTADLGKGRFAFAGGVGWDPGLGAIALPSVELFDATGFGFERIPADLASPRAFPAIVALPGGGALLAGGVAVPSFDQPAVQTAEFLAADGTPTGETPLAIPRVFASATGFQKDGVANVLIAGGSPSLDIAAPDNTLQHLVAKKLTSDIFSLHSKRAAFTATELADGRVLFAGGFARVPVFGESELVGPTATAELFDTTSPPYESDTGPMSQPRWGHTATLLDDGTVLMVGGSGEAPDVAGLARANGSTDLFLPAHDQSPAEFRFPWPAGGRTSARAHHAAVKLATGEVLVTGGSTFAGAWVAGSNGNLAIGCASLYRPAAHAFRDAGSMIIPRYGHAAVTLPGGQVLLVGGYDKTGRPQSTAEVYTPCWSDAECEAVNGPPAEPPESCP